MYIYPDINYYSLLNYYCNATKLNYQSLLVRAGEVCVCVYVCVCVCVCVCSTAPANAAAQINLNYSSYY